MTRQLLKRIVRLEARRLAGEMRSRRVVLQWVDPVRREAFFDSEQYVRTRLSAEKDGIEGGDGEDNCRNSAEPD